MPIEIKNDPSLFFTSMEAAAVLKVSRISVMKWIAQKKLYAKKVGKGYRISSQALHEFVTGQKTKNN